jgi:hypothetical protein
VSSPPSVFTHFALLRPVFIGQMLGAQHIFTATKIVTISFINDSLSLFQHGRTLQRYCFAFIPWGLPRVDPSPASRGQPGAPRVDTLRSIPGATGSKCWIYACRIPRTRRTARLGIFPGSDAISLNVGLETTWNQHRTARAQYRTGVLASTAIANCRCYPQLSSA